MAEIFSALLFGAEKVTIGEKVPFARPCPRDQALTDVHTRKDINAAAETGVNTGDILLLDRTTASRVLDLEFTR